MRTYIRPGAHYSSPISYTLKLIEKNKGVHFVHVTEPGQADLIFDDTHEQSQKIAVDFYQQLVSPSPNLQHENVFRDQQLIRTTTGHPDLLATVFYMVNCLQEYNAPAGSLDRFQRFKYEASYQKKYNSIEQNLVQQYIYTWMSDHRLTGTQHKSAFFISHDIDTIYGSLMEDGLWAVKKGRIDIALKLMAKEIAGKPDWKNIDRIMSITSEYDIKSTFFWLVNKGKGDHGIKNADYAVEREQKLLARVREKGFINGLHKSCSAMSIDQELEKGKIENGYNRYHFLRFLPQTSWPEIGASKLRFDSSLGFAEHYGFRNSYGQPFQPFDIQNGKLFDFVEAPLHFMDTTFHKYMKMPKDKIADTVIDFYERNRENCVFSLLWHNTYFTQYKYGGFLEQYKKLLGYFYENKIECLTPEQIIERYHIAN